MEFVNCVLKGNKMKILFKILIILSITLLVSCKRDRDETRGQSKEKVTIKLSNPVVNVYIENSGSMFGYINGNTEFKTDVRELLTLLKYHYGDNKVNLSFINSNIYPIKTDNKMDYITHLNPSIFKIGNTFSSEMNNVFKQVLNKTSKNTISILVSDCIYSVNGKADDLSLQKTGTKDAFLTKSKGGFNISTAIVKLNSKFNGIYYDMNNEKHKLNNEMRPYYMVLMGSDLALNDISSKVDFPKKMQGFQNKLVLTSNNYSNKIYYTLVNAISDNGRYKTLRDASTKESIKGMKDIQLNNSGKGNFTFSIAIDLSNVPVENSYAKSINNYQIKGRNYKIKSIQEFNSTLLKPNALPILQNNKKYPTHIITFESTTKNFTDLKCVLENKIPDWVNRTTTEDDTNLNSNKNKTFGFKYLIEGISEANQVINSNYKDFFEINITIKNN